MTLTKDDLQAIAQIVDERLEAQLEVKLEEKLEEKLDAKLEEKLEAKLEEKLEAKLEEKLDAKLEEKLEVKLEEKLDAKFEGKFETKMDLKLAPILRRLDRLEEKVDDLQTDMIYVRKHVCNLDHMVKSEVIPRLKTIEGCYVSTYDRYRRYADGMERTMEDMDQLKRITADHSRRLQRLESIG